MEQVFHKLVNELEGTEWVLFGSAAIAVHNGSFHRGLDDIDLIIDDDMDKIARRIDKLSNKSRRGRKRAEFFINNCKVELLFVTDRNTIKLADGIFTFNVTTKIFKGLTLPVVDIPSLVSSKERHLVSLLNADANYENKIKNCKTDITILERLTG